MMMKDKELIDKMLYSKGMKERCQLFLLHFAGGSCYSFDFFKKQIDPDIEFIPLEIPGRGKRFREELLKNKKSVIDDYFNQISNLRNNQPYLIYGHSMGATIGLSVTEKMESIEDPPCHLVVSGNPGPGIKECNRSKEKIKRYLMKDDDFKKELRKLGGVPEEVLQNDELYKFFSPIMRADFEVLEKDNFSEEGIQLKTPIYALMGSDEETSSKISNWNAFTSKKFTSEILEGNHFFIYNHTEKITRVLEKCFEVLVLQN